MNLKQILETPGCELLNEWLMLNFGETLSDRLPPMDDSEEFDEVDGPAVAELSSTVCIPITEYQELCKDSKTLNVLHQMGVDNWEGYDDAIGQIDYNE